MLDEKQAHLCIWVMRRASLLFSSVICQVLFWWRTFIMMLKTTRRLKRSVRLTWNIHISMMLWTNFNQYYSQSKSFWFIYVWQCCSAKAGYDSIRMISKRWLSKHTVEFPSIFFFKSSRHHVLEHSLSRSLSPLVTAVVGRSRPVPTTNSHIPGKSSTCSII